MQWIILGIAILIILWAIGCYNGLVRLKLKVEEAFASMDVFLKKRYDLIPNIVETVKGYAKHESQTLENVIKARNSALGSTDMESQVANENVLQGTLKTLFALTESYPDLKANTNFINLQDQLNSIETEIERSRRYYNGTVLNYNTKIHTFPSLIIAGLFRFTAKPMFEVSDASQRENVKVQF